MEIRRRPRVRAAYGRKRTGRSGLENAESGHWAFERTPVRQAHTCFAQCPGIRVGRKSEAPSSTFWEFVSAGAVGLKDGGWRFAYLTYLANFCYGIVLSRDLAQITSSELPELLLPFYTYPQATPGWLENVAVRPPGNIGL
jgi:hypothetical protein